MDFLYAALLGSVQGITEFLPISSSAHLIIFSFFIQKEVLPLFLNVALHLGSAFALLVYFYKDWFKLIIKIFNRILYKSSSFESDILFPALIIGSIPAGIIGILWENEIEKIFHNPLCVTVPLIVVGILLWLVDKKAYSIKTYNNMNIRDAFLIGLAQALALIPGVSRSGITIIQGRILGYHKEDAAKFSFILATPAVVGAAILESKKILMYINNVNFYIGFIFSFLVGCLAIKFLLKFIKKYGFGIFAIYRILLAVTIIIWFLVIR